MDVHSHLLCLIFCFLDSSDLLRVSATCLAWWKFVYAGPTSRFERQLEESKELDISGTSLYTFVPLRIFRGVLSLNLGCTNVSSLHLQQIVKESELQYLNVSSCPRIEDNFVFHSKEYLDELTQLDISHNPNITLLGLACLCSYSDLKLIQVHGMKLTPNELLFLVKTFNSVSSGDCDIETEDGEYPLRLLREFEPELFADELRVGELFDFYNNL